MKYLLIFSLITFLSLFGYELTDNFLMPGSYDLYYGDSGLINLNWGAQGFTQESDLQYWDIDSVVTHFNLNTDQVANKPFITFKQEVNSSAACKIVYVDLPLYYSEFTKDWEDAIQLFEFNPNTYGGKTSFTITVNKDIEGWDATNDEMNMKSVLAHELGHSFGANDQDASAEALMYYTTELKSVTTTMSRMPNEDDLNAFIAVYEKPSLQLMTPYRTVGDTLEVLYENESDSVEFEITTPSLLEYNSVTPPPLTAKGFITDLEDGYLNFTSNIDSIGLNTYRCRMKISELHSEMEKGAIKFKVYNERASWTYGTYGHSPCEEKIFKMSPKPTLESPIPNKVYPVRPSEKSSEADTLAIKVRVPQILGSYPDINIKIDGVYVNQGDINFDSSENVWIYYWDLSTTNPTLDGKRYNIVAEIDGDPTSYDATGIYLVEAIYYEDFETMTSLSTAGWWKSVYENPDVFHFGWWLGIDILDASNICLYSETVNSKTVSYLIEAPGISIPEVPGRSTILSYDVYYGEIESGLHSWLIFNVSNMAGSPLLPSSILLTPINEEWVNITYDLSQFAGQTIRPYWVHSYSNPSSIYCAITAYGMDNIAVYTIPDMEGPHIDYITGTNADLNEDMNLVVGFNDTSGIDGVTADYTIDGDSGSLTLYPSKTNYDYTGTISAKDHECNGTIRFKIMDGTGNETLSSLYNISWAVGTPILSIPENVVITAVNDSIASISWDLVVGATSYKVYSSPDPYGTFTEDTTGTFTESRVWEKTIGGNKYFYYVIATNSTKFDVDAIKEEEFEIAKAKEDVSDR